ncbi:cupin domain-containing protein [Pseudobacteriovorax antillogorgiicola]|uniref:Anti-ECFsigma factor, ChrR n=1 Tax=Pseudobacteriovorax antillogorgiicola TaxID=1513793 RepID=A0A1Y6CR13_9BACT|nr:cupin domain-containing protein [Pseudobacteriovorax antillogorgiicola]TCS41799.1 ChrR-like anti-ECFsigma factor [Pseudobacteriovorax antillogorgiicola]SMF83476.1 anti-ECFsigma factor, ChrR [Pseudobacteriovorax antillogorgiicola]
MFTPLNMNFEKNVVVRSHEQTPIASPAKDVMRIPLERAETESGHVTSIVEYKPGASFKPHRHPKGEEIFVLSGVFSDENGDYPAGTYIRNPPGSSHAPFSTEGCTIFVKLNQFDKNDDKKVVLNTSVEPWLPGQGNLEVMPLHHFAGKNTALVKWPQGERFVPHRHYGGEEILVLSGTFRDEWGVYPTGTWLRNGHLSTHHPWVEEETVILVKTGHLAHDVS